MEISEIQKILEDEVLKREVIEGEAASKARSRVNRISSKSSRKSKVTESLTNEPSSESTISLSEQLLKESSEET